MPDDTEDIKNEINAFCTAKPDVRSCVEGVLQGINISKRLRRENKEQLLERAQEVITKRLLE